MNKLIALATALILAIASTASTAQAKMRGVGIGIGIGVGLGAAAAIANSNRAEQAREYRQRKKARAVRRESKGSVSTAKKAKTKPEKTQEAARQAPAAANPEAADNEASGIAGATGGEQPVTATGSVETAVQTENSSISLATARDGAPVVKVDTASQEVKKLDCKKFFPSVGMTLSVPCE